MPAFESSQRLVDRSYVQGSPKWGNTAKVLVWISPSQKKIQGKCEVWSESKWMQYLKHLEQEEKNE